MNDLGYMGKYLGRERPGLFRFLFPPSAVITTEKRFPDISFYQGTVDFDKMWSMTNALIIRAGQNLWVDTQFSHNYSEAKRRGMKRGTYWFYDDRISPIAQAGILINLLKDDRPEMEIFADWERSYGGTYGGLARVVQFMQTVEAGLSGARVGIYTGYYWFRDHSNAMTNAEEYEYLRDRPLWLAWYTSNPAYVSIPAPWTRVTHWQYGTPALGSSYGVESSNIDMNYFNGTTADFNARYSTAEPPPPPPTGDPIMGTITYSNNVKVITGTHRTSTGVDWAYRAIVIPAEAIFKAVFYRPSATTVENIEGDIVFNWSPFTASGPRFGLRINNVTIKPWSTEAMPFPWWTSDNRAFINHPQAIFNAALNAAQGFRYLIENGVRNVNPSADWSFRAARRLIAANAEGDTILVSVKGISGQEQGLTLYECCDLLFSLGLGVTTAADGDSGGSTQDYIKIDGVKQVFRGDASAVINVPVYGVIKLTSPTTGGTIPEPPPDEPPPPPPPPVMTSHNMIADFDAEGNVTEVFVDGVKFVRP